MKHHATTLGLTAFAVLCVLRTVPASAQVCTVPPSGLLSWWPGGGNADDIVGQNHGTLIGDVTFGPGIVGQAFAFNGAGEVIVLNNDNLNVQIFTLTAWVFPTLLDGRIDIVVNKESATQFPIQYEMGIRGSGDPSVGTIPEGNFAFFVGGMNGLPNEFRGWVDGNAAVPLNRWTHVAMTFDGTSAGAYINGELTKMVSNLRGDVPVTSGPLKIGSRSDHAIAQVPCTRFNGLIDEVGVYNRALAAEEIRAIFDAGSAGKCRGGLFARFEPRDVSLKFATPGSESFSFSGEYELDENTNGIDPENEDVSISFGTYTEMLPGGTFVCDSAACSFDGEGPGITRATITSSRVAFVAEGIDLSGTTNPMNIAVHIGDDVGQASVRLHGPLSLPGSTSDLLNQLSIQIESLDLPRGIETILLAKVNAALLALQDVGGDTNHAAANILSAFIKTVEALRGSKIRAADADGLLSAAEEIISRLGGSRERGPLRFGEQLQRRP